MLATAKMRLGNKRILFELVMHLCFSQVEVTFNFLEIRAMNTYPEHQVRAAIPANCTIVAPLTLTGLKLSLSVQVIIDTDKTTYSLRLQTQEQLDHMVSHINYALSRVFNNSIYA